jgi:biotin transport system substrate-specific component
MLKVCHGKIIIGGKMAEKTKILPISTKKVAYCALFSALIAVGAFMKIPGPVPFTLQFPFANLAALLFGKFLGFLAPAVYVAIGLLGFPVFTGGGGIGYVMKPTFGYLFGFALGGFVAGLIIEKSKTKNFGAYFLASLANLLTVYFCGVIYGYFLMDFYMGGRHGLWYFVLYWFLVFLPTDLFHCFWTSAAAKKISREKDL